MTNNNENKKPPTEATGSGESENELAGKVFYAYCNTKPANYKIDHAKQADVFRQHANYFSTMAEISDNLSKIAALQEQANITLMPIYAGGTVYLIPGGANED